MNKKNDDFRDMMPDSREIYDPWIKDSDGTWVSGWYTVTDENGNEHGIKDRD